MPYWRLLYHLVWTTFDRQPSLRGQCEELLHQILRGKASELGVVVYALGNAEDHVHLVVSIPPKLAVSECVRHLKGASSHALNHAGSLAVFRWQEGYGVLSLTDQVLRTAIDYVLGQKQHHRSNTTRATYEQSSDPTGS
ncbi:MAG: IS200/IS605 family transposase [Deltaproteobacteria bacterium]|nr:IS200/IS605 family transposase [Deltaproteobacteria bacterium]